jgi:hypothetical protein
MLFEYGFGDGKILCSNAVQRYVFRLCGKADQLYSDEEAAGRKIADAVSAVGVGSGPRMQIGKLNDRARERRAARIGNASG